MKKQQLTNKRNDLIMLLSRHIDKDEFIKYKMDYIKNNEQLCKDVLVHIDQIKMYLQRITAVKLNTLDYSDSFQPYVNDETSKLDETDCDQFMKTLLGMLSDTDYTKVRKLLIDIMLKGDSDNKEKKNSCKTYFSQNIS